MTGKAARTVSQRQFLRHVAETAATVRYAWPGRFRADHLQVRITLEGDRLGTFLGKLGEVLPFPAYDRLSREIWLAHMHAEDRRQAGGASDDESLAPEP